MKGANWIDNEWYEINGTPCQYGEIANVFFWEDEDGLQFFHAPSNEFIKSHNIKIKHLENYEK